MHTKESITALLEKNDKAVLKALKILDFRGQYDPKFAKSLLEFYEETGDLTERQFIHARKLVIRYASTLARIANEKEEEKQERIAIQEEPMTNEEVFSQYGY